ncbi:MFS transporter [Streptomyces sp. cmx-4-9]|uniref:MFS transporter n=1 Tax=Streptomyces sp. cmx-4-9 TaxID=2790941 RepID=UPI00397FFF72
MKQVLDKPEKKEARSRPAGLVAYYAAALAIRTSDAGTAAAVVLLALSTAGAGAEGAAAYSGLLAACLTIPHMLGPLSARFLSLMPSARSGLCVSFAVFAVTFGAAGVLIHRDSPLLAAAALAVTGFLGPIVTGGLSSHLSSLVPVEQRSQRRAQSADSLTYAISNSVGNSLVGAAAAVVSPLATVFMLCGLAAAAAVLTSALPLEDTDRASKARASMKNVLLAMVRIKQLRDIVIITYGNVIGYGSLIVLSTTFARSHGLPASVGALLLSVMGLGSLLVAAWLIVRPLALDVVTAAKWSAVISGVFMVVPAFTGVWVAGVAFLVVGGCQALLNTAALAIRREASPPDLRESVFVTMAGLKVGVGTLGLALAGLVPAEHMAYGFLAAGGLSVVAGLLPRSPK